MACAACEIGHLVRQGDAVASVVVAPLNSHMCKVNCSLQNNRP